jgi:hypothetical protein
MLVRAPNRCPAEKRDHRHERVFRRCRQRRDTVPDCAESQTRVTTAVVGKRPYLDTRRACHRPDVWISLNELRRRIVAALTGESADADHGAEDSEHGCDAKSAPRNRRLRPRTPKRYLPARGRRRTAAPFRTASPADDLGRVHHRTAVVGAGDPGPAQGLADRPSSPKDREEEGANQGNG